MRARVAMLLLAGLVPALVGAQALTFTPAPGAPEARVGGNIRGAEQELALTILAPSVLANAAASRPTFYWHASHPVEYPVEIVLIEEGGEEPLFETLLHPPLGAGRHTVALPEGVRLTPGTVYQLSIAAVADADVRSNDIFASTLLRRTAPPAALPEPSFARARQLAASGFWFDALHLLIQEPGQTGALNSLLQSAGLPTQGEVRQ